MRRSTLVWTGVVGASVVLAFWLKGPPPKPVTSSDPMPGKFTCHGLAPGMTAEEMRAKCSLDARGEYREKGFNWYDVGGCEFVHMRQDGKDLFHLFSLVSGQLERDGKPVLKLGMSHEEAKEALQFPIDDTAKSYYKIDGGYLELVFRSDKLEQVHLSEVRRGPTLAGILWEPMLQAQSPEVKPRAADPQVVQAVLRGTGYVRAETAAVVLGRQAEALLQWGDYARLERLLQAGRRSQRAWGLPGDPGMWLIRREGQKEAIDRWSHARSTPLARMVCATFWMVTAGQERDPVGIDRARKAFETLSPSTAKGPHGSPLESGTTTSIQEPLYRIFPAVFVTRTARKMADLRPGWESVQRCLADDWPLAMMGARSILMETGGLDVESVLANYSASLDAGTVAFVHASVVHWLSRTVLSYHRGWAPSKVEEGYRKWLQREPRSSFWLNAAARTAVEFPKPDQAKVWLARLGRRWDPSIWQTYPFYVSQCRRFGLDPDAPGDLPAVIPVGAEAKEFAYPLNLGSCLRAQVEDLLDRQQFAEVEAVATALRASGTDNQMENFYAAVRVFTGERRIYENRLATLQRWCQAYPKSKTAGVCLASFLLDFAQLARGGGYANTVTDTDRALMLSRHAEARKALDAAPDNHDSHRYVLEIRMQIFGGRDRAKVESLALECQKAHPHDRALYQQLAVYYLPRWFGEPGALADLAARMAQQEPRQGVYPLLAIALYPYDKEESFRPDYVSALAWQKVVAGFASFRADRSLSNYCAVLALLHRDKAATRTAMRQAGRCDTNVWRTDQWEAARKWAEGNGQPPAVNMPYL